MLRTFYCFLRFFAAQFQGLFCQPIPRNIMIFELCLSTYWTWPFLAPGFVHDLFCAGSTQIMSTSKHQYRWFKLFQANGTVHLSAISIFLVGLNNLRWDFLKMENMHKQKCIFQISYLSFSTQFAQS